MSERTARHVEPQRPGRFHIHWPRRREFANPRRYDECRCGARRTVYLGFHGGCCVSGRPYGWPGEGKGWVRKAEWPVFDLSSCDWRREMAS